MTWALTFIIFCFSVFMLSESAFGDYYVRDPNRGTQTIAHPAPGSSAEECVRMKHFPGISYPKNDDESEVQLCRFDFYNDPAVAICPKLTNSNPGVYVRPVPPGVSKEDFEATACKTPDTPKIAALKSSITCSYTPSILGYYHLSRILGGGDVPVAVIRTMAAAAHQNVVKIANEALADDESASRQLRRGWGVHWPEAYADPDKYSSLFEKGATGIYGALSEKIQETHTYIEIVGHGEEGPSGLKNMPAQKEVFDSRPISEMTARDFRSAAPLMIRMKDASDIIVMDYIMSQEDRSGNAGFVPYWVTYKNKKIEWTPLKGTWKNPDPEQAAIMHARGAVAVKKAVMKDNDCGIVMTNNTKKFGLLDDLAHLSPQTYRRFLWFETQIDSSRVKEYFKTELLMTGDDIDTVTALTHEAADKLRAKCLEGRLRLDLDLKAFLTGQEDATTCDLPAHYEPNKDVANGFSLSKRLTPALKLYSHKRKPH